MKTIVYPLKAQYLKGESVSLHIESDTEFFKGVIFVYSLEKESLVQTFSCKGKETDVELGDFYGSVGGYGVRALIDFGKKTQNVYTAFDIAADKNQSLRYGFLSDFEEKDLGNGALEWMRRCHINLVQFYDWSYRHDNLVCEDKEYIDMMGKRISGEVVKEKIKIAKEYGMLSTAYGAIYAASKKYYEENPTLAFFYPNGTPITFIDVFYIMNVEKDSPWRKHLIEQYAKAMKVMGFSGIHMDTYGFPKSAKSHIGEQHTVYLDEEVKSLIDETNVFLTKEGLEPTLIFNNVGNWPVYASANANQKAVYIEVWDPYDKYHHIAEIIRSAKNTLKVPKPIILAAYLKPFRTENVERGMNAARILMAEIVSLGAYHLLTGEGKAVLTQGYYSDYTKLDEESADKLCSYYDFSIRYMDLFYDESLKDVSMTHFGGDNMEYFSSDERVSVNACPNSVFTVIRENKNVKTISFINLMGNDEDSWNEGKEKALVQKSIDFSVQTDEAVEGVFYAEAENEDQILKPLNFERSDTERGSVIHFIIPEIKNWTLVYIKMKGEQNE